MSVILAGWPLIFRVAFIKVIPGNPAGPLEIVWAPAKERAGVGTEKQPFPT